MRFAALLLLAPLGLIAQTKPEDLAAVEGQVFDAATGGTVRRAAVVLRPANTTRTSASIGYSASTDGSGNFAMKDLEPGRYRMTVSHAGYVDGEYGSRGPGRQGATLQLDRAQRLTGLVVKLTPQGVVTGRIVDRDGDPVSGAWVQLLRFRYQQGRKQLQASDIGSTNDLGEYRIFGVAPGKYYVCATYQRNALLNQTVDRSANAPGIEDYVPVYYPGTADVATALDLRVTPGAQVRADLTLDKMRTSRITGRVVKPADDSPANAAAVVLTPRGTAVGSLFNKSTTAGRDGTFELRGIAPGSYYLAASVNQAGTTQSIRMPVDVGGSDISDVTLAVGPGVEVNGHVRIDGDSAVRVNSIRLSLQPRETGFAAASARNAGAQEDGTFRMVQVNPDVYSLSFPGLPAGFYVKSLKTGDTDILASGLDLINGAPGDVDVVLSPNASQVAGLVQNPDTQQPVAGATVVLIPQDKERREQQRDYRIATTDQSGGFNLSSVVPGEYQVYAWEDVESGAYFDPEFMTPIESKGQKISLHEKDQLSLQLTVIPADAR
jgi:hypothetical protein